MLQNEDLIFKLRVLPSFSNLDDHELSKVCTIGVRRSVQTGEYINQEGITRNEIQIILDGEVELKIGGLVIKSIQLGPGNIFGDISFFSGNPYMGTTIALTEVQILTIFNADLQKLLEENPL